VTGVLRDGYGLVDGRNCFATYQPTGIGSEVMRDDPWCVVATCCSAALLSAQFPHQPGFGERPVAPDRPRRGLQDFCNLLLS